MAEVVDHYHGIRGFIVLAHFCEQHGPSVSFCTRLVRSDNSLYEFSQPPSSNGTTSSTPSTILISPSKSTAKTTPPLSSSLSFQRIPTKLKAAATPLSRSLFPSKLDLLESSSPISSRDQVSNADNDSGPLEATETPTVDETIGPSSSSSSSASSSASVVARKSLLAGMDLSPVLPSSRQHRRGDEETRTPAAETPQLTEGSREKRTRHRRSLRKPDNISIDPFASVIAFTPLSTKLHRATPDKYPHDDDEEVDDDSSGSASDSSLSSADISDPESPRSRRFARDSTDDDVDDVVLTLMSKSYRQTRMKVKSLLSHREGSQNDESDDDNDNDNDDNDDGNEKKKEKSGKKEKKEKQQKADKASGKSNTTTTTTIPASTTTGHQDEQPTSSSSNCIACNSVSEGRGFFSHDTAGTSYSISTRYPEPTVYSRIRRACVRSLSCEQCIGREGSVVFEEDNTSTFAYLFKLSDAKARGYQRFYSLLFILPNLPQLLTAHPYLEASFRVIVADLKNRSEQLFLKEQAAQQTRNPGSAFYPSGVGLQNFRRRIGMHTLRNLTEIVGLPDLYKRLHAQFSQVLFGCYSLLNEKSLNFNVGVVAFPRQVSHHSKNKDKHAAFTAFLARQQESTDPETLNDQVTEVFEILMEDLGQDGMLRLIYQTIIGNQIIVRGAPPEQTALILKACSFLIPECCRVIVPSSECYCQSWQCNLLGLAAHVQLPVDTDFTSLLILDYSAASQRFEFCTTPCLAVHCTPALARTTLGDEALRIIMQTGLSPHFRRIALQIKVEEWVNKAKLFIKLAKSIQDENDAKLGQFNRIFSLTKADTKVLRFFSTGMKRPIIISHFLWNKTVSE